MGFTMCNIGNWVPLPWELAIRKFETVRGTEYELQYNNYKSRRYRKRRQAKKFARKILTRHGYETIARTILS